MLRVGFPFTRPQRLTFYLAAEEFLARSGGAESYVMPWIVEPTVIMGRNQVADAEVDLDYCRRHRIDVVRRKSGGGCVYADPGNMMLSFVVGGGAVEVVFRRVVARVADALSSLGVPARVDGRNDILVEGRKICGYAYYQVAGRSIVHGTMLYDTNPANMTAAITPSRSKMASKGVASVASRIGLLKNFTPMSLPQLRHSLLSRLASGEASLTAADIRAVRAIELGYSDEEFLLGRSPRHTMRHTARIEGCGTLTASVDVERGKVADISLEGDFFNTSRQLRPWLDAMRGRNFTPADIEACLAGQGDASLHVVGLTNAALLRLLFSPDAASAPAAQPRGNGADARPTA